jgi:hypothetical protein
VSLKIAFIIGSTRPNRFADKVVSWFLEEAGSRTDMVVEMVDLRDQDLPFMNESRSPGLTGGKGLVRTSSADSTPTLRRPLSTITAPPLSSRTRWIPRSWHGLESRLAL